MNSIDGFKNTTIVHYNPENFSDIDFVVVEVTEQDESDTVPKIDDVHD